MKDPEWEHDCNNPKKKDPAGREKFLLVPRIGVGTEGQGRVWLEYCPECGPHIGDQVLNYLDGKLCRVEHVQPGGPWPNWTPGVGVYHEERPYTHSFIGRWVEITKRREEFVAERLMA